jgi:predicted aspartyl protease
MVSMRNPSGGRVTLIVEVSNRGDAVLAERGQLSPEKVRKATISGIVDTGAAQLVLPGKTAAELGVTKIGEASVRFADNRRENRAVVEDVELHLLGRKATFNAIVEPGRTDALVSAIVLEALDFVVDCTGQKLVPRDPDGIFAEIE